MAAECPGAPLGLLLFALCSLGGALELSVVSPVTAVVGSDALLECAYTVQSPSVDLQYLGILWRFNENKLLVYGVGMEAVDPRASINESQIPNGKASLLLSNVTTSDEGPYTCSITYTPDKEQKTVILNIQAQPVIIVPEQEVVIGKENLLRCFVIGFYPADIDVLWQRDGVVLPGSSMSKAKRNVDGTFTVNSTLPITPTDSDTRANFTCHATHVSLPRFIQKEVLFTVVEEKGVSAAAIVVPLVLLGILSVGVSGWFLYRKLKCRRLCKIQGPERWMVDELVELVCVGHHWPTDTAIMWQKFQGGEMMEIPDRSSSDKQQVELPLLNEDTSTCRYHAKTETAREGGSNITITTTLQITPSLEGDLGATFKCIFSLNRKSEEEEEFSVFKLFAKPQFTGRIDCIPWNGRKVKCSLELTQFYPQEIEIDWSSGKGILQYIPSEDHRAFAVRSECEIPEENFSDRDFSICARWKHESLQKRGITDMSVTHKDCPGHPVAGDIVVPRLVSGVEASLQCLVSSYFSPTGLEVAWLKLKGSSALVPLSGGNDGCVSSMTPEQKEPPYSRTAQLTFLPDFHSDQESVFVCQVSHPSLLETLKKCTPKLSVMSAPRYRNTTIAPSGNGAVVTLNVTDVYPKKIAIKWSSDLPGKEGDLKSNDEEEKSIDGTYNISSHCQLTAHMIRKIGQADINVSIKHEALKEPLIVTMQLENIDNKLVVKVLRP